MSKRTHRRKSDPVPEGYYEEITRTKEIIRRHPYDPESAPAPADRRKSSDKAPRRESRDVPKRVEDAPSGSKSYSRPSANANGSDYRRPSRNDRDASNSYSRPSGSRQSQSRPLRPQNNTSSYAPTSQSSVDLSSRRMPYQRPPRLSVASESGYSSNPRRPSQPFQSNYGYSGARNDPFYVDTREMEDYNSPRRGDGGRYSYNQPFASESYAPSQGQNGATFRVRIHRANGIFSELEDVERRVLPSTYIAAHTSTERGHTGVVEEELNPVFNDEFIFESPDPDRDALVCTLVSLNPFAAKDKKVAECVISLKNLMWGVEREVWVPMVRHPGTSYAYERGELLVSIFSEDYGVDELPTEEEEAYFSEEVQRILVKYAPEELHKLDWLVGEYLCQGEDGLAILLSKYRRRASIPRNSINTSSISQSRPSAITAGPTSNGGAGSPGALVVYNDPNGNVVGDNNTSSQQRRSTVVNPDAAKVRITVLELKGLVDSDGRPIAADTCYLTINNGSRDEQRSKTVPYQRKAVFNQDFRVAIANPDQDAVHITVFAGGRRVGEVDFALTNMKAGVNKDVTLMIVRSAETSDAANGGEITLSLRTETFTSLNQLSEEKEKEARERVLVYLWNYLRDELHLTDPVVATIDDLDLYMKEWADAIGPERRLRHLTVNVQGCREAFPASALGLPHRCYVRVVSGPFVSRTELAQLRENALSFSSSINIGVCDPSREAVELMLIEETETTEKEISRIVFAVNDLLKGRPVVKKFPLVINAGTSSAKIQGSIEVELTAEDFGSKNEAAPQTDFTQSAQSAGLSADNLHRAPYAVTNPTAAASEEPRRGTADPSRGVAAGGVAGNTIKGAPMTVKILGLKDFRPGCDCYVKVFLNGTAILRTKDCTSGGSACVLSIADNNEVTTQLHDAASAVLTFKIGRHRHLRRSAELGTVEVSLGSLICGEKNTLWVPISNDTDSKSHEKKEQRSKSKERKDSSKPVEDLSKIKENRMPSPKNGDFTYNSGGSTVVHPALAGAGGACVGLLGLELQSNAFPITEIPIYKSSKGRESSATPNGSASKGRSEGNPQDVNADVTSLLTKFRPSELGKVQPMIAQCSSIKTAHQEIRAKVAPRAVEATFYIHIDKIDLASEDARTQERQGGFSIEASFNGDRQISQKSGSTYSPIRLDVGPPAGEDGKAGPLTLTLCAGRRPTYSNNGASSNTRNSSTFVSQNPDFPETKSPKKRRDSKPMGGKNNLASYMDTSNLNGNHQKLSAENFNALAVQQTYQGEVAEVQLSMRAFLSWPLHKLGDTISVPLIQPSGVGGNKTGKVLGQVVFHITAPAFEELPEWARLASDITLDEIEPDFVHYYVKRIGAFLREYKVDDLRTFHYSLYERDVASGRWYISLPDHLQSLIKRYGQEVKKFPPPPPLSFDPQEKEFARQQEEALYGGDDDIFAESEAGVEESHGGDQGSIGGLKRSSRSQRSRRHKKSGKSSSSEKGSEAAYGF